MNTTTDCCSLDFSDTGTSTSTSQSSSESSAHIIDEEEIMINMQQETPSFDSCSRNMNLKTKKYSLHEHVLLLKCEHQNRILMKSKSDRTALRESSAVCNYLNYKAVKSDRTLVVHHKENKVTQTNQRLPPKNYIPDPVWDEHRRRFPTKKEQVVAKRPQTKEQHVHLPVVLEKTQTPPPTIGRRELLQRTKSFPDRRRSSLLRQHSFPRGLQDSNRYNYQDFLQDEIDFEEKFLLPDEDIRRAECHKTMLPYSFPRLLESRHKNKANISIFLFNSSLLWNSFKHSFKPNGAGLTMKVPKEILSIIKILPGNDCCFDCNSRHDLVWAFVPHGTILCESCGLEHLRNVHDDDILSFSGDLDWKFKELISLLEGGNKATLSFLKQRSIENREHENVAKAMKEKDFGSLYNSKTASQYRKLMRKKVQTVVWRYHDGLSCTD